MLSYNPDWVSPPGDTIVDITEERGLSLEGLAVSLGMVKKDFTQLIRGEAPITLEIASKLEQIFGVSAEFWIRLEANYQNRVENLKK